MGGKQIPSPVFQGVEHAFIKNSSLIATKNRPSAMNVGIEFAAGAASKFLANLTVNQIPYFAPVAPVNGIAPTQ